MASEGGETRENDDEKNDELDATKNVLQTKTPLQSETVDEEGRGNTCETNASLVPAVDRDLGGVENIFSENNTVRSGPTKEYNVSSLF
jgi:hypothetical protein